MDRDAKILVLIGALFAQHFDCGIGYRLGTGISERQTQVNVIAHGDTLVFFAYHIGPTP
jgi:hypothetical protein